MKARLLAGAAVLALCAATGASATEDGWYGAIDVGAHKAPGKLERPIRGNDPVFSADPTFNMKSEVDVAAFARIGYQFVPHFRVEIEGGYRPSDIKSVNSRGGGQISLGNINGTGGKPDGSIDAWTAMANAIFDVAPNSKLDPFIGAGAGAVHVKLRQRGELTGSGIPAAGGAGIDSTIDHSQTIFGYQGLAGVSYAVSDRLNVDLTYRYLRTSAHYQYLNRSVQENSSVLYSSRYEDHAVTLGLRYAFAAPPAPPPPPPPPPPPAPPPPPPPEAAPPPPPPAFTTRDYVIYFPFDQYVITPEAQSVLQDAARYASDGHAQREVVVGHTDTSGSVAYNLRLSERRAKATADALVSLGVPQTSLDVSWTGKSDLAVQTGDQVKEPLNRRSTIHIQF